MPPLTVFSKAGVRKVVLPELCSALQESSISILSSKSSNFYPKREAFPLGQMERNALQRLVCLKEVASQRVPPHCSECFCSTTSPVAMTE